MGLNATRAFLFAYEISQIKRPLFNDKNRGTQPLTFDDSLYSVPNYPFCTLGVLIADGRWGTLKGVAFVVEDNYLLTCASNIYSHVHNKQYDNITFSIDSNRKTGQEIYNIAKVFIPKEYIELSKEKRDKFNYALLYIEGKPNLTDRYGSLGGHFDVQKEKQRLLYLNCALDKEGKLKLIGKHKLAERMPAIMDGGPIVMEGDDRAFGLTFVDRERGEPAFLLFSHATYQQLADWVNIFYGRLNLGNLSLKDGTFIDKSKQEQVKQNIDRIINVVNVNNIFPDNNLIVQKRIQILITYLPRSSLLVLDISSNKIGDNSIAFLKNEKFRNLKQLDLSDNRFGPLGCKDIVDASFSNLRVLSLRGNKIGSEGCDILLKGQWPFLTTLTLCKCEIGTEGTRSLGLKYWPNLAKLFLGEDQLDNEQLSPLGQSSFPRLELLSIKQTNIDACGLSFLMSPSWKSLRQLDLNTILLGSKGCKLLKQSNIAFVTLSLCSCKINAIGIKWLCKADLSRTQNLQLSYAQIGEKGCFYLSRTKLSALQNIRLGWIQFMRMNERGLKLLLLADWAQQLAMEYRNNVFYKSKEKFSVFKDRFLAFQ